MEQRRIIRITHEIWEETRRLNIEFKKKEPGLKNFWWWCWDFMLPDMKREYLEWVTYLIDNDLPDFSAEERHYQSVQNRLKSGWKLDDERNDIRKTDPYLTSLWTCPAWFQELCDEKDKLMIKILKQRII